MSFKMPWAAGSKSTKQNKTDVSLDDVLPTTMIRVELILLVVLCTDSMRETLEAAFDVPKTPSPATPISPRPQPPSKDLLQLDEPATSPDTQRKDLSYVRNWTLASDELQSLRAASTTYFNTWRTSVLRRLGEKLKVQPDAVKRAKANYRTSLEAESMARRHLQDLKFASDDNRKSRKSPPTSPSGDPIMPILSPAVSTTSTTPSKFHTKLNDLDDKTRALILNATLFILLSLETYPAHSRVLLNMVAANLELPNDVLVSAEANLAMTLQQSTSQPQKTATIPGSAENSGATNRWKIGLATVAGAALVGVTGGLAAPFLLSAAGAIMGGVGLGGLASLLGATIANPVTVAALFGVLGGRMGGRAMEEYVRDIEDFEILPVLDDPLVIERLTNIDEAEKQQTPGDDHDKRILWDGSSKDETQQPRTNTKQHQTRSNPGTEKAADPDPNIPTNPPHLRSTLCISGPLSTHSETITPWQVLSPQHSTPLALRYEPHALLRLGSSIDTVLRRSAFSLAQAGALQFALPALSAALLPVSLLSLGSWLDNPFSIAMERSDKAGKALAEILIEGGLGRRPVTLIGYSTGARVVYACLMELASRSSTGNGTSTVTNASTAPRDTTRPENERRKDTKPTAPALGLDLIENVVMIGAPVASDEHLWRRIRGIVPGRVVNVYTTNDLLLGYLYRVRYAQLGVAGLEPIRGVPGVENHDVTGLVKGHAQYRLAVGRVLREINWDGLVGEKLEEGERRLQREDQEEREVHETARRNGELGEAEDGDGKIVMVDSTIVGAGHVSDGDTEGGGGSGDGGSAGGGRGRQLQTKRAGHSSSTSNRASAVNLEPDDNGDGNVDSNSTSTSNSTTTRYTRKDQPDHHATASETKTAHHDRTHHPDSTGQHDQTNRRRHSQQHSDNISNSNSNSDGQLQTSGDQQPTDDEAESTRVSLEMIDLQPEPEPEP